MGMFDRITAHCATCGNTLELQSKAGKCQFNTYSLQAAPLAIAADIENEVIACGKCHNKSQIKFKPGQPRTIEMVSENFEQGVADDN